MVSGNTDPDDIIGHLSLYQLVLWIIVTSTFMIPGVNNILSVFIQANLNFECQSNTNLTINDQCTDCEKFIFNTTIDMESTVKSEWDLVCGKGYLSDLSTSFYYVGFAAGGIIGGYYSEKFGRKPVLFWSTVVSTLLSLGLAFTTDFYQFMILRTLVGFAAIVQSISAYPLAIELVGAKYRTLLSRMLKDMFVNYVDSI